MDWVQVLIAAFGGGAAMLLVAGFLGRSLIEQWLARATDAAHVRLQHESDAALESLRAQLQHESRVDDRHYELEQVMRRYEGPLAHAVHDLQSRLFNALRRDFFGRYLLGGTPSQRRYAIDNSVFLIAQYCGWTEIIRQEIQFIEFAQTDKTRRLSALRDEIYGLWQTNRFGDALMIWAGEQRAIGELMIEPGGDHLACKGYAAFLKAIDGTTPPEPLVERLREALAAGASEPATHARLLAIQHTLVDMLDVLDPDALRFPSATRTKA